MQQLLIQLRLRNISIGQTIKSIILVVLNLIKNNIKFSFKWLIILIINYSCTNNLKVSEREFCLLQLGLCDQFQLLKECTDLEADKVCYVLEK